jgi:hypothetical protein
MIKQYGASAGFPKHTQEFFGSVDVVLSRATGVVSLLAYFLFGRSVAFALKAFVMHDGLFNSVLKSKYGGNKNPKIAFRGLHVPDRMRVLSVRDSHAHTRHSTHCWRYPIAAAR